MALPRLHTARARTPSDGDQLLVVVVRRAGGWIVPLVLLAVLGAAAEVALPAVLGHSVDRVVAWHSGRAGEDAIRGALVAAAGLLGTIVAVDAISQWVEGSGAARATARLRRDVVRHLVGVGPNLTERTPPGDLVARVVGNTSTTAQVVTTGVGLATAIIPPAGAVVALAIVDPLLAGTFAVGLLVASGAVRAYLHAAHAATTGYLEAQGAVTARLVDALGGARSIAAAGTVDREVDRVLGPLEGLRRHGADLWHSMARMAFRGEPIVLVSQVAVVAVAGLRLAAGRLTPGELLAASRYAFMAAGISGLVGELAVLSRARAASSRVAEVLDQPTPKYGRDPAPAGPGQLELRGISAGRGQTPVLGDLHLVVPAGCTVALVGASGAGKSLTAAIAGRLQDPDTGEVLLDDVPLRRLRRPQLRRAIRFAFDRPVLVGQTVADAIGLGIEQPTSARIRQAARAAGAHDFVERLPGGYSACLEETPLSGGEVQRLGIARAVAHDARVLILDDATSSLDTATEAAVSAALTAPMPRVTRLVVTHRAATARRADMVAWLHDGRIRALGTHDHLCHDPDYQAIFDSAANVRVVT